MVNKDIIDELNKLANEHNIQLLILNKDEWSEEMRIEVLKAAVGVLVKHGKIVLS
ncbi:hypothetical protein Erwinia_phage_Papaline_00067 [Erwinia phage Papaline]|nr:hypothetical protein Erwinia_phage_Papaline_00067 [Erwinia phage Papaline]